jgi:hypothetical protein
VETLVKALAINDYGLFAVLVAVIVAAVAVWRRI